MLPGSGSVRDANPPLSVAPATPQPMTPMTPASVDSGIVPQLQ